ncbi:MAG TPA: FKBP-type peptidyl-prolyl cis-trans isomerase [Opitutaceae bacterium]|nr:FKBP-type peptidyl-prolyl cis-trans isomerase [Opitutaceae bacterium]
MPTNQPRSIFVLILLGIALLTVALVVRSGIAARKNPGKPINKYARLALEQNGVLQLSSEDAEIVEKKWPGARITETGLRFVVKAVGEGTKPKSGQELVVHYDGRLITGGKFDSSLDRGVPLTFRVGVGDVIKGWDEAFLDMRKGEKRTLIVPYWLGYGESSRGPLIPPRATLVFEVELIDIR